MNYRLKKLFSDGEIDENSVIRRFRITAADGKTYNTNHYFDAAVAKNYLTKDELSAMARIVNAYSGFNHGRKTEAGRNQKVCRKRFP